MSDLFNLAHRFALVTGAGWRDGRVQIRLEVNWNGTCFGSPHAGQTAFGFDQLIAHAPTAETWWRGP
jgi:hypothetical protein